ncbi:hypothetical protein [Radiobacillus sp. PE A8.2]|uniref:hypothetical protein n=1 Tax=Radiobacillus sp. PE A8.2 TaxID=3380349 RepID=UPI00388FCDD6
MRRMNQCFQCYDHMLVLLHDVTHNYISSDHREDYFTKYQASGLGKITCQSCGREVEYTSRENNNWYEMGTKKVN